MEQAAIYLLVDTSKTQEGSLDPNMRNAIHLFFSYLDGIPFYDAVSLYTLAIDRNPNPIVKNLNESEDRLQVLDCPTNSSAGLDLSSGLSEFINHVKKYSHKKVKTIVFLKERSGTPIYSKIKILESMSESIEPFMIIACSETAKLHKKNIPNAIWLDVCDFLPHSHQILSEWFSTIHMKKEKDVIHNFGYNPEESLQDLIHSVTAHSEIELIPREFKGPIVIDKPLSLDGKGATIWVRKGPGIIINSDGVNLRNLQVEVTEANTLFEDNDDCAIKMGSDLTIEVNNIIVRGTVLGMVGEEGVWSYPHTLDLGILPSRVHTNGILRLKVPAKVKIASQIECLELDTDILQEGSNEINMKIGPMFPNTLIYGTVTLQTEQIKRIIYVRGYVIAEEVKKKKKIQSTVFWQPVDWNETSMKDNKTSLLERLFIYFKNKKFNRTGQ